MSPSKFNEPRAVLYCRRFVMINMTLFNWHNTYDAKAKLCSGNHQNTILSLISLISFNQAYDYTKQNPTHGNL